MLDLETCVVVDSGALSTTVAVVIGGRVMPQRWRLLPVGGWHVAHHLKQAIYWQPKEYHQIPTSYLDILAIKERCRLSYNIKNEEKHTGQKAREHINLRVDNYADCKQFWVCIWPKGKFADNFFVFGKIFYKNIVPFRESH